MALGPAEIALRREVEGEKEEYPGQDKPNPAQFPHEFPGLFVRHAHFSIENGDRFEAVRSSGHPTRLTLRRQEKTRCVKN
jgi:hypothetical protein